MLTERIEFIGLREGTEGTAKEQEAEKPAGANDRAERRGRAKLQPDLHNEFPIVGAILVV